MIEQPSRPRSGQARGIFRVLLAQGVLGAFAVLVCWFAAGSAGALSALAGAAAYFVPNVLFAMRLVLGLVGSGKASPAVFLIGEVLKLGATVALLAFVAWRGQAWLVWPALLFGLLCVLKGYVLLLVLRRLP